MASINDVAKEAGVGVVVPDLDYPLFSCLVKNIDGCEPIRTFFKEFCLLIKSDYPISTFLPQKAKPYVRIQFSGMPLAVRFAR